MKKQYDKPEINVIRFEEMAPLASSGVGGNNGMGFGGFDEKGIDADAPFRRSPFDGFPFFPF